MNKYRVFVSYTMRGNGINVEFLQLLKQRFGEHNLIETYIDIIDNCGEDHQTYVENQLKDADVVLLIQSDSIESSMWVEKELSIAKEYGIPVYKVSLDKMMPIIDDKIKVDHIEKELIKLAQIKALR